MLCNKINTVIFLLQKNSTMKSDTTSLAGIVSYGDTSQSEAQDKLQQVRDITNNTKHVILLINIKQKVRKTNIIENSVVEINDSDSSK